MTMFSKNLGGTWPLWPLPGYAYVSHLFVFRCWARASTGELRFRVEVVNKEKSGNHVGLHSVDSWHEMFG